MYHFKLIYNKRDTVYVISLIFVDRILRGKSLTDQQRLE